MLATGDVTLSVAKCATPDCDVQLDPAQQSTGNVKLVASTSIHPVDPLGTYWLVLYDLSSGRQFARVFTTSNRPVTTLTALDGVAWNDNRYVAVVLDDITTASQQWPPKPALVLGVSETVAADPWSVTLTKTGSTLVARSNYRGWTSSQSDGRDIPGLEGIEIWDATARSWLPSCPPEPADSCMKSGVDAGHAYVAVVSQADRTRVLASSDPAVIPVDPTTDGRPRGPGIDEQGNAVNLSELQTVCGCSDPVNTATGNLVQTAMDISVGGRGPGLDVSRTYSSGQASGDGYTMRLQFGPGNDVAVVQENGSIVHFIGSATGTFAAAKGVLASLVRNADGSLTFKRHRGLVSQDFDATGRLIRIRDTNANTITLIYSGDRLDRVSDAAGRAVTFNYVGARVASATGPMGRTWQYLYSPSGDLTEVEDPLGKVTKHEYDAGHRLVKTTDARGAVVSTVYTDGRVSKQTDPTGGVTTFAYTGTPVSEAGGTATMTDRHGAKTVFEYKLMQLVAVTRGFGTSLAARTTYDYGSVYGKDRITDPTGSVVVSEYDADGNLTSVSQPSRGGAVVPSTTFGYDGFGQLRNRRSPGQNAASWSYDTVTGNLTSATDPLGNVTTYQRTDPAHPDDVTGLVDAEGRVTGFTYSAAGDVTSVTTHPTATVANTTVTQFNAAGEAACSVSPRQRAAGVTCPAVGAAHVLGTTTWERDPLGRVVRTTDSDGRSTTAGYDENDNVTRITDGKGQATTQAFDLAGRQTSAVVGAEGPAPQTSSTVFDVPPGQSSCPTGTDVAYCVRNVDAKGLVTVKSFDVRDQLTRMVRPDGRQTSYAYDAGGAVTTVTEPTGQRVTYSYNPAHRLTRRDYSNPVTADVAFTYRDDDQRATMTDGTGTSSYSYDNAGRLTQVTNGAGAKVGYGYDKTGRVRTLTYPDAMVATYGYDQAGQLTSVNDGAGHANTFGYDPDGAPATATLGNSTSIARTFDRSGVLDTQRLSRAGADLWTVDLTRDANAMVTQRTETGAGAATSSFGYDDKNRLATSGSSTYGYDDDDQPTTFTGRTQTFNTAGTLASSASGGSSDTFGYDSDGNRLSRNRPSGANTTYMYDQANRLLSSSAGDRYRPVTPARIADTRAGSGKPNAGQTLAPGGHIDVQVTGAGGVPTTGVTDVVINVTEVSATALGYVTVYPTGGSGGASLTFPAGRPATYQTTAKVGTGGKISVSNYSGGSSVNVIVDVVGYFSSSGGGWIPTGPALLSERTVTANGTQSWNLAGTFGVPATATAVRVRITTVDPATAGTIVAHASTTARPAVTTVTYPAALTKTSESRSRSVGRPAGSRSRISAPAAS